MSDLEPDLILPPDTGTGGLGFDLLDPLGVIQPSAGGAQPRSAQRAWAGMMGTMGRKVPNHLKWSLRYRNAMMTLSRQRSRL